MDYSCKMSNDAISNVNMRYALTAILLLEGLPLHFIIGSSPRNAGLGSDALQSDHTRVAVVAAQKSLNCIVTLETDV